MSHLFSEMRASLSLSGFHFPFLPLPSSGLQPASCLKKDLLIATVVGNVFENTGAPPELVFLLICR